MGRKKSEFERNKTIEEVKMKKEYDLSKMKFRKTPYAKFLKKQVTIRLNVEAIAYFKNLSKETGISYQQLIDSYLSDCVHKNRRISVNWE